MLERYTNVDPPISKAAIHKMRGHLWYLSEDLVCLALFDDHLPDTLKKKLVARLSKPAKASDVRRLGPMSLPEFLTVELPDFATIRSMNLFEALSLPQDFLSVSPELWESSGKYQQAKQIVREVRVVNDCSERAVKLATEFNLALTKDEEQRQLLFQVIEFHQRLLPTTASKHNIVALINNKIRSRVISRLRIQGGGDVVLFRRPLKWFNIDSDQKYFQWR